MKFHIMLIFTWILHCFSKTTQRTLPFTFDVLDSNGNKIELNSIIGPNILAVLFVNVASQCGYTDVNYRELQSIYERYKPQGLEIIAFPCNQFGIPLMGGQEPGSMAEILQFAQSKYSASFPIMSKIDVNGKSQSPVYKWLKANSDDSSDIKWNFGKFLVLLQDDGTFTVQRYGHQQNPFYIEADIRRSLRRLSMVEPDEDGDL